jgi:flagellar hook-associated protein 3 FlgL
MRVNPNQTANLLDALSLARREEQQALLELSSGRRVNVPSDDPAAAAMLVSNNDQATLTDRYQQSVASIQGQLQMADSTLSSFETALPRGIALGDRKSGG